MKARDRVSLRKARKKSLPIPTLEEKLKIFKEKENFYNNKLLEIKLNPVQEKILPPKKIKNNKKKMLKFKVCIPKDYKESKGEGLIRYYLKSKSLCYKKEVVFQSLPRLRFDFYLPNYRTCIEFDGIQHFEYVDTFDNGDLENLGRRKFNDELKNKFCRKYGILLIRIPYNKIDNISELLYNKLFKK